MAATVLADLVSVAIRVTHTFRTGEENAYPKGTTLVRGAVGVCIALALTGLAHAVIAPQTHGQSSTISAALAGDGGDTVTRDTGLVFTALAHVGAPAIQGNATL